MPASKAVGRPLRRPVARLCGTRGYQRFKTRRGYWCARCSRRRRVGLRFALPLLQLLQHPGAQLLQEGAGEGARRHARGQRQGPQLHSHRLRGSRTTARGRLRHLRPNTGIIHCCGSCVVVAEPHLLGTRYLLPIAVCLLLLRLILRRQGHKLGAARGAAQLEGVRSAAGTIGICARVRQQKAVGRSRDMLGCIGYNGAGPALPHDGRALWTWRPQLTFITRPSKNPCVPSLPALKAHHQVGPPPTAGAAHSCRRCLLQRLQRLPPPQGSSRGRPQSHPSTPQSLPRLLQPPRCRPAPPPPAGRPPLAAPACCGPGRRTAPLPAPGRQLACCVAGYGEAGRQAGKRFRGV